MLESLSGRVCVQVGGCTKGSWRLSELIIVNELLRKVGIELLGQLKMIDQFQRLGLRNGPWYVLVFPSTKCLDSTDVFHVHKIVFTCFQRYQNFFVASVTVFMPHCG